MAQELHLPLQEPAPSGTPRTPNICRVDKGNNLMPVTMPFLVVSLIVGLAFLVFISLAVMDRLEDYKLSAKGK